MPTRYVFSLILLVAFGHLIGKSSSANVLCMFTSTVKNQLVVFMAVANTLIDRDHNVTIVTTMAIPPQSFGKKPFRHVFLKQSKDIMDNLDNSIISTIDECKINENKAMISFIQVVRKMTIIQRNALQGEQFQEFLREDNHFDLMVLGYFHNDFIVGVAGRYNCPIALVTLGPPYGSINRMVGNPEETSYVPLFGRKMNFEQRMLTFFWAVLEPFIQVYAHSVMNEFYKSVFTDQFYPKYSDMIHNISIVLSNNHFTQMPVRPLVPAIIEIGGIQIKEKPDPLPEDIQTFLDSSVNGTIFYCVGTRTHGPLKPDKINIILNVFSKLNQTVLWEWNHSSPVPKNFSNIFFKSRVPYEDVLFHKNVKLFITDGRPHALFTSQNCGVPMIGIPIYTDEPFSIEEMASKGYGIGVELNDLTEPNFENAVFKLLKNPSFTQKVRNFANIFRDRPLSARETAAFWLEYVIRHRGAPHLQSPVVQMNFVRRWNLDLVALIGGAIYAFVKLIKFVVLLVRTIQFTTQRLKDFGKYKIS